MFLFIINKNCFNIFFSCEVGKQREIFIEVKFKDDLKFYG